MTRKDLLEHIPEIAADLDIKTLNITPFQAFVFSRVDGRTNVENIALSTGFDLPSVERALEQLAALGALCASSPPPANAPSQADACATASPGAGDPLQRVEALYSQLPSVNYYELLGVPRSATRGEIKAAYYSYVNTIHPDRFFGRDLGALQSKLEQVFQRLTEAHDTLTKKRLRADYDGELRRKEQEQDLSQVLTSEGQRIDKMRALKQELSPSGPPAASSKSPPSITFINEDAPEDLENLAPQSRRRGLARKLAKSLKPSSASQRPQTAGPNRPQSSIEPPTGASVRVNGEAPFSLRGDSVSLLEISEDAQVQRYLDAADSALEEESHVSAANSLRLAHSLRPSDPVISGKLKVAERMAAEANWRENLKQAERALRDGDHHGAGVLYSKVALGNPRVEFFEKAAACFFEVEADLRRGAECAKRGLALAPERTSLRLLLGKIYTRARMIQSAISQLQHVLRVDPSNAEARSWLKNAKSAED